MRTRLSISLASRARSLALLGAACVALVASPASAAVIASYETGLEGWNSSIAAPGLTLTTSAFGATAGTSALLVDNLQPGFKQGIARTGNFNSSLPAAFNSLYPVFSAAGAQMAAGLFPTLEFDLTTDVSAVTVDGSLQFALFTNSDSVAVPAIGGFKQFGTGALINGNALSTFPVLANSGANNATLQGVTMTTTGAGRIHVSIPMGVGKTINFGPSSSFYNLGFQSNGGWTGTVDWAIDNVQINLVPEPATATLGLTVALAALSVRRRTARRS